jgi:hypothetical protein
MKVDEQALSGANIYSLNFMKVPLCVECPGCGRRQLLTADQLSPYKDATADMTPLVLLARRMKCSACGERGAAAGVPISVSEAYRWLADGGMLMGYRGRR